MLAKSASGALEYVPMVTVENLARALAELKGAATSPSGSTAATPASPRRRCGRRSRWCSAPRARACGDVTRATCDVVAQLDLPGKIKSLNVSNATALALYVATTRLTSRSA